MKKNSRIFLFDLKKNKTLYFYIFILVFFMIGLMFYVEAWSKIISSLVVYFLFVELVKIILKRKNKWSKEFESFLELIWLIFFLVLIVKFFL